MGILITILIYSFILTVVFCWKDSSSYSIGMEPIDAIIGGPFMWLLLLLLASIRLFRKSNKRKEKEQKTYTSEQKAAIVKKFIGIWKSIQKKNKHYEAIWLLHPKQYIAYDITGIERIYNLKLRQPLHERIERKFHRLCYSSDVEIFDLIRQYARPLNDNDIKDFNTYERNLYKGYDIIVLERE